MKDVDLHQCQLELKVVQVEETRMALSAKEEGKSWADLQIPRRVCWVPREEFHLLLLRPDCCLGMRDNTRMNKSSWC